MNTKLTEKDMNDHIAWQRRRDEQIDAEILVNRGWIFDAIEDKPISRRTRWLGLTADVALGALVVAAVAMVLALLVVSPLIAVAAWARGFFTP